MSTLTMAMLWWSVVFGAAFGPIVWSLVKRG
jgi:hypothetical protein